MGRRCGQQGRSHRLAESGRKGLMVAVGLSGIKKGCRGDSGSGRLGKAHAGPSSSFTDGPASPYLPVAKLLRPSRSSPTRRGVRLGDDSEVDDPGGEVEGRLLAIVDHRDAVAVPIAGSRHAALEDGEGRPGGHGRAGWAGVRGRTSGIHGLSWQPGRPVPGLCEAGLPPQDGAGQTPICS